MTTTRKTRKPCPMQHEIDGNVVENDLDALFEMFEIYEDDNKLVFLIMEAIDIVGANLGVCITADDFQTSD